MSRSETPASNGTETTKKRRLHTLAELEKGDVNPETIGKSSLSLNETVVKDGEGDALMDEKDQIAFDEKLAQQIHEAEVHEQQAREQRQQASQTLQKRLSERRRRHIRLSSPPEVKRFIPAVQITQCSAADLWEIVTNAEITVYGYKPMSVKGQFEVIYVDKAHMNGMVVLDEKEKEKQSPVLEPSFQEKAVAVATQALMSSDAVIGTIQTHKTTQTSPVFTSTTTTTTPAHILPSPVLTASKTPKTAIDAPMAPMRQLPFSFAKAKEKPSMVKPPSRLQRLFHLACVQGAGVVTAAKKKKIIQVDEDDNPEVPATQKVDWSPDADPQVIEDYFESASDRLWAKTVDRYAREEAAQTSTTQEKSTPVVKKEKSKGR